MKIKLTIVLLATLIMICSVFMASCDIDYYLSYAEKLLDRAGVSDLIPDLGGEDNESQIKGRLYFHNGKETAMLVDSTGGLVSLYSEKKGIFDDFSTGDLVTVYCGAIMESYPAQTYISKIVLIEDGDEDSFTEEEKDRIAGVYGELEEGYVGNNSGNVSEGRLYFSENRDKVLLVSKEYGPNWLYAQNKSLYDGFDTGDYVKVDHGAVMLSYPGQTNISGLTLIEDGDVSDFTEEELKMIEQVMD